MPAQRWQLGSPPGGLLPDNERGALEVAVPEFEIDAQAVNWARYVEFADDAGYDRRELWSDAGWAWVQAQGRRAPLHVEQLHGGVLVQRGVGKGAGLQRAPAAQAVMHLSRHEAEAWCRWAGRRLPTEPEWEIVASSGASRGFVWGDVFEWVAGSARAWPGAGPATPGSLDGMPAEGSQGVLRGGSFATRARWRRAKARRFAPPERDTMFCGFRSCAL
jgi:formylglycine-generating enzyme required for sulfatase activity